MKAIHFISILILTFSILKSNAQIQTEQGRLKSKKIKLNNIGVGVGFGIFVANYKNQANFLGDVMDIKIASKLLQLDKGYTWDYERAGGDVGYFAMPIKFSFIPYSDKKGDYNYKREIQFGISYYMIRDDMFGEKTTAYNADSVIYSKVKYVGMMKFINLDAAYLFQIFHIGKRFNGRLGLEAAAGKSYKSEIYRRTSGTDTVSNQVSSCDLFVQYPKNWGQKSDYYGIPRYSLYNIELAVRFELNYKITERTTIAVTIQEGHQQMFSGKEKNVPGLSCQGIWSLKYYLK